MFVFAVYYVFRSLAQIVTGKMFKTLEEIITHYRSMGRFSFTLETLKAKMPLSEKAILQALYRYRRNGRIAMIRKGFYVILLPEYTRQGGIPALYYIDDMMQWLNRSYYLSLFSAAALHGASHQQVMASWIMIKRPPMRDIVLKNLAIYFIVSSQWDDSLIMSKKTDAGYIPVSCPALTAMDLVAFHNYAGILRSADTLIELAESIEPDRMVKTSRSFKSTAAIQRLGYFFDRQGEGELARILHNELIHRKSHYVPLSVHHPRKGKYLKKWKIIENTEIETEL